MKKKQQAKALDRDGALETLPPDAVLYFDSNALRSGNWPRVRDALREVFTFARMRNLGLAIPEPVLLEVGAHYERLMDKAKDSIKAVCDQMYGPPTKGIIKKLEESFGGYQMLANWVRDRYQIRHVAFTDKPVEFFFQRRLQRLPPFEGGGENFRDATIMFSVLDDLRNLSPPCPVAVFVTNDGHFDGMEKTAEEEGHKLKVMSLDQVTEILRRGGAAKELAAAPSRSWFRFSIPMAYSFSLSDGAVHLEGRGSRTWLTEDSPLKIHNSYAPNQPVNLGGTIAELWFGTGAATIRERHFEHVYYIGKITFDCQRCVPNGPGEWSVPFECHGSIRAHLNQPRIDVSNPLFGIRVKGSGTTLLELLANTDPIAAPESALTFAGLDYRFDNISLEYEPLKIPVLDLAPEP